MWVINFTGAFCNNKWTHWTNYISPLAKNFKSVLKDLCACICCIKMVDLISQVFRWNKYLPIPSIVRLTTTGHLKVVLTACVKYRGWRCSSTNCQVQQDWCKWLASGKNILITLGRNLKLAFAAATIKMHGEEDCTCFNHEVFIRWCLHF